MLEYHPFPSTTFRVKCGARKHHVNINADRISRKNAHDYFHFFKHFYKLGRIEEAGGESELLKRKGKQKFHRAVQHCILTNTMGR